MTSTNIGPERMAFVIHLMIVFGAAVGLIAVCATIVVVSVFRKTERGAARALSLMVNQAGGLQLLTVIVIGTSVLVLRLLDLISADAAISSLTGIAGFVLGGVTRERHKPPEHDAASRISN